MNNSLYRIQSLACEAVHNHSIQQDAKEIAHWVNWLYKESGRPITLIGHSAGSLSSEIHRYRLAFCDNYSSKAKDYLSYLAWDPKRTLNAISSMKVKPTIIFGGDNHFFDHTHEFDLLDIIETLL